jgi:hypothetical protein
VGDCEMGEWTARAGGFIRESLAENKLRDHGLVSRATDRVSATIEFGVDRAETNLMVPQDRRSGD